MLRLSACPWCDARRHVYVPRMALSARVVGYGGHPHGGQWGGGAVHGITVLHVQMITGVCRRHLAIQ